MSPVIVFYGIGVRITLFNVLFSIEQCVADFSNALPVPNLLCGLDHELAIVDAFNFSAAKLYR
jgi:hypothetical protein